MKKIKVGLSLLFILTGCSSSNIPTEDITRVTYATVEDLDSDRELILTSDEYLPVIELINSSEFSISKDTLLEDGVSIKLQEMFIIYYTETDGTPITQHMLFITEDKYVGLILDGNIDTVLFANDEVSNQILLSIYDAIS
jgi:hypothetical protein